MYRLIFGCKGSEYVSVDSYIYKISTWKYES